MLIVFRPSVDVLLTIFQHSIDQSGQPVSHGGDGFRGAELAAQASVLRAEVGLASQEGGGPQPQCGGRAVEHVTSSSTEHFVADDAVVWTESSGTWPAL